MPRHAHAPPADLHARETTTTTAVLADPADTARWVAAYRARESARADALVRDPFAARLAGERGARLAEGMVESASFEWSVVVRTRVIDEMLEGAIARGADTVLNLGAGLDARPYRLALPPALRWIEADDPRLIESKADALRDAVPSCRVERVAVDLADGSARRALLDRVAGTSERVLVLTEGVVVYLTLDAVARLADELRARPAFAHWITDYGSPLLSTAMRVRTALARPFRNAPLRAAPRDWHGFYREHGWRVAAMRYLPVEGARLGRPIALPPWFRPVERVLPASWRRAIDTMMGHALLEPAG